MPKCECHGEAMWWNRDERCRAGGHWRCNVKSREEHRRYFDQLSGMKYAKRQLDVRRNTALWRRRKRKEQHGPVQG